MLADAPDGTPLPGLRLAVSTASPLNVRIAAQFKQRYEMPLSQALGIIEVGLPAVNVDFAATRPDGVGRILSNYRLRLEDCGLGPGVGEVLLSGNGVLDAYYHPWQVRDDIMRDGWFHTGDVGELDSQGCLFIRGRTKDVINVAGMKVFPLEVEKVLDAHPAVADACVFAEKELRCGEVPHARVVLKSNESASPRELIEYCRSRLAAHKVPRELDIVAALDRTPSGKILHRQQTVRVSHELMPQMT
jgi:acyl-CoA synthetase (AMP-forming)/AMP-acid ligase II